MTVRRFSFAAITGGAALALTTAVAPVAAAQAERVAQIENAHFRECLTISQERGVALGPCGSSPLNLWSVPRGGVGQIRNLPTGQCLEDAGTNNPWGEAVVRPCTGNPRQLWHAPAVGHGPIVNVGSERFLKANDDRRVYVGSAEEYHPVWVIR